MKKFQEELDALAYGPNDYLELHVQYRNGWSADVVSLQLRGWCEFVGIVTSNHHGATPEEAARKAVDAVPGNWGYEPNEFRATDRGLESIPLKREKAA